jgi:hypothetical protein
MQLQLPKVPKYLNQQQGLAGGPNIKVLRLCPTSLNNLTIEISLATPGSNRDSTQMAYDADTATHSINSGQALARLVPIRFSSVKLRRFCCCL